MKYSQAEIRGAILRAADRLDGGAPYNFMNGYITLEGGQYPGCRGACMWHYIGVELGIKHSTALETEAAAGCKYHELYDFGIALSEPYMSRVDAAVRVMRAFAAAKFPAPAIPEDRQLVPWASCPWSPHAHRQTDSQLASARMATSDHGGRG